MPKMVFRRVLGGIYPTDERGEKFIKRLKNNDLCVIEGKIPRNVKLLQKFWVILDKVIENVEGGFLDGMPFTTADDLCDALKIATGRCKKIPCVTDKRIVFVQPSSIAIDAMDELEFEEFYNRAMDLITRDVLPLCSPEFEQEFSNLLDPAFRGVPR